MKLFSMSVVIGKVLVVVMCLSILCPTNTSLVTRPLPAEEKPGTHCLCMCVNIPSF